MCISHGVAGPRQGALEGAAQVVERPRYYYIIVETHQRGHTQHPYADAWKRRHSVVVLEVVCLQQGYCVWNHLD